MSKEIDLYDFDKTVYDGDSALDFYFFCLRKKPWLVVYTPYQLLHAVLFALKLENRTQFKSNFFIFLRSLKDTDNYVNDFWEEHFFKIKEWYRSQDHSNDVIISASPEFLLKPAFSRLKAKALIATLMNPRTGRIIGKNNRGDEKIVRLMQIINEPQVRKVYTDHKSDAPILELAQEKYLVKGNIITKIE